MATGAELDRIEFDSPVQWLEFDGRWLVISERNDSDLSGVEVQDRISSFNLDTQEQFSVVSSAKLWIP